MDFTETIIPLALMALSDSEPILRARGITVK